MKFHSKLILLLLVLALGLSACGKKPNKLGCDKCMTGYQTYPAY